MLKFHAENSFGAMCIRFNRYLYVYSISVIHKTILPIGVSSPSFSLTTISDWPSIRNLGGRLASTPFISNRTAIRTYNVGFNRTRGGRLARIAGSHLTHWTLLLFETKSIFLMIFFARFHRGKTRPVLYR